MVLRFVHHNGSFAVGPDAPCAPPSPLFLSFVLCLGIIVEAIVSNGLGDLINRLVLSGQTSLGLLAVAAITALLSNPINNLPASADSPGQPCSPSPRTSSLTVWAMSGLFGMESRLM
ncbi:hypothetical protein [Cutibacterium sp. V947]|uniref:hypothetical protein n=1 Tax=unclassified Cutibacterium TaxID=2649671 RepID=UPI003EE36E64